MSATMPLGAYPLWYLHIAVLHNIRSDLRLSTTMYMLRFTATSIIALFVYSIPHNLCHVRGEAHKRHSGKSGRCRCLRPECPQGVDSSHSQRIPRAK
jgi:hypothetical protein